MTSKLAKPALMASTTLNIVLAFWGISQALEGSARTEGELGVLTRDLSIGRFDGHTEIFTLPRGLVVRDVSATGAGWFEPNRFEIIVTSDRTDLIEPIDPPPEDAQFYSADIDRRRRLMESDDLARVHGAPAPFVQELPNPFQPGELVRVPTWERLAPGWRVGRPQPGGPLRRTRSATPLLRYGGQPVLPAGIEWPRDSHGERAAFFGVLDFSRAPALLELPAEGYLCLFVEGSFADRLVLRSGRTLVPADGPVFGGGNKVGWMLSDGDVVPRSTDPHLGGAGEWMQGVPSARVFLDARLAEGDEGLAAALPPEADVGHRPRIVGVDEVVALVERDLGQGDDPRRWFQGAEDWRLLLQVEPAGARFSVLIRDEDRAAGRFDRCFVYTELD